MKANNIDSPQIHHLMEVPINPDFADILLNKGETLYDSNGLAHMRIAGVTFEAKALTALMKNAGIERLKEFNPEELYKMDGYCISGEQLLYIIGEICGSPIDPQHKGMICLNNV